MPSVSMGSCARLRRFMMSDLVNSVNKRYSKRSDVAVHSTMQQNALMLRNEILKRCHAHPRKCWRNHCLVRIIVESISPDVLIEGEDCTHVRHW